MSSATPRRTPAASTASGASGRRAPTATSASPTPGARGASPSTVLTSNGTAGLGTKHSTPTGRPARPTTRRPAGASSSNVNAEEEARLEDVRAESAALVESLRQSLKEAESSSEDFKRQLGAAQSKIEDLMSEQTRLEEQYQQSSDRVQELEFDQREAKRHAQEMERIYDGERNAMLRDREDASGREKELKATIQRLKENIAEKEFRATGGGSRHDEAESANKMEEEAEPQFAPSSEARKDSQGSRVHVQKDQIIESLRLELADAQIKLIEMENAGGDRVQDLEKTLLETRMENARLQEDNESFQLLLGERTISGDFQKTELMQGGGGSSAAPAGLGSLAEELESAEGENTHSRRLEVELRSLKDQNKALTLYIEKIISRVLQHDNFETILDQKGGLGAIPGRASSNVDKDLPPPPPSKDDKAQDGFLQRATSVVRRQRPVSAMFTSTTAQGTDDGPTLTARHPRPSSSEQHHQAMRQPTANENPATAPSIPLGRSVSQRGPRGHNRLSSLSATSGTSGTSGIGSGPLSGGTLPSSPEASRTAEPSRGTEIPGAAGIVNQMYRGPSSPTTGRMSPLMSPGGTRGAYFGPGVGSPTSKPRQLSETTVNATAAPSGEEGTSGDPSDMAAPRAVSPTPHSVDGSTLSPPTTSFATSAQGAPQSSSSHSRTGSLTPTTTSATASTSAASIGDAGSTGGSGPTSPPRDRAGNTQYTGAVMQQNRLRPLRLVQQSGGEDEAAAAAAAAAARKKANRGSWMGWFNRGKEEGGMPGGAGGLPGVGE